MAAPPFTCLLEVEDLAEVLISQGPSADANSFGSGRVPANPGGGGRLIFMVQALGTQITCPRSQVVGQTRGHDISNSLLWSVSVHTQACLCFRLCLSLFPHFILVEKNTQKNSHLQPLSIYGNL